MRQALAFIVLLFTLPAVAAPVNSGHVEAELVAAREAIVPGERFTVALRLRMDDQWHTYWRNPGDSGLATTLAWRLPPGFSAGAIQWPAPMRIDVGPLTTYGYEKEILLLTELEAPADLAGGSPVTLRARGDWLVCKEVCIPEFAELSLTLPVLTGASPRPSRWAGRIEAVRAALPQPLAGARASAHRVAAERVELALAAESGAVPSALQFFPYDEGKIQASAAQAYISHERGVRLVLTPSTQPVGDFTRVSGVITGTSPDGRKFSASVDVPIAAGAPPDLGAARAASGAPAPGLLAALLLAFAGGVILNLMPCVFPVLSIKVLSAVRGAHRPARDRIAHGAFFAAGVLASFLSLAGALLVLRAAGAQLGWGFQLQSPVTVAALALLFFALALNLSGVYAFTFGPPLAAARGPRHPHLNAFMGGVLAAVVASPCTAPFMGAALGYAVTQPAPAALGIFAALALGMAAPFFLLCCYPRLLARLPRPGAWMERLQQFLAFPLYATVIWLAWVLGTQAGVNAMVRLACALLAAGIAAWAYGLWQRGAGWGRAGAIFAAIAALALAWPLAQTAEALSARQASDGEWEPYSNVRLAELNAAGTPAFVDFTAAWCVTCQVNKRLVLDRPAVLNAFGARGVVLLRADWTRRDPEIGAALNAIGRTGVPVYALYVPGRPPLLLPELLRERFVLDALQDLKPVNVAKEDKQ